MNFKWLRFVTKVEHVIFSTAYDSLLNFHFVGMHLDHCWPVSGKGLLCILAWLLSHFYYSKPVPHFNILLPHSQTSYATLKKQFIGILVIQLWPNKHFPLLTDHSLLGNRVMWLFAHLFTALHWLRYLNRQMTQSSINLWEAVLCSKSWLEIFCEDFSNKTWKSLKRECKTFL